MALGPGHLRDRGQSGIPQMQRSPPIRKGFGLGGAQAARFFDFRFPRGMYAWTGSCCQQYCHLLYLDSFVPQPGAAHTRPSEYVLFGRGSVRTAAPRNLSSCMRSHPSQGPVLTGMGSGPLVPCTNSSGRRFIPPRPIRLGHPPFMEPYGAMVTPAGDT